MSTLAVWVIFESKQARKLIPKLPKRVLEKYEFWKSVVEISGPEGLCKLPGFRDEALRGKWIGCRSSRLSLHWRVIYRSHRPQVSVHVERITPHDYRK